MLYTGNLCNIVHQLYLHKSTLKNRKGKHREEKFWKDMDRASVTCGTESRGLIYRTEVSGGKREKGTEKNLMIHLSINFPNLIKTSTHRYSQLSEHQVK